MRRRLQNCTESDFLLNEVENFRGFLSTLLLQRYQVLYRKSAEKYSFISIHGAAINWKKSSHILRRLQNVQI